MNKPLPTARNDRRPSAFQRVRALGRLLLWAMLVTYAGGIYSPLVAAPAANNRKAIMMGRGDPFREPDGGYTHPQRAKVNFLNAVGNPSNDPRKGWTCEFEWDLKVKYGMDPTNTPAETLFKYLADHRLGYRIAMNCGPAGQTAGYWGCAVDNGIMPFAPHYNNMRTRFDDPLGIRAAVSVGGGVDRTVSSYGQSLELFDAVPAFGQPGVEDTAESWANQAAAARFARVLDAHPGYNIWDAREHLRQSANFWPSGWTETNGYGRANEKAAITALQPGPPVEFSAKLSRDRHHVAFNWRNFLQSDFAATVIARRDGRILYKGAGTNFVWKCDVDGDETFQYWSENKAGQKSRLETCQSRTLSGLEQGAYRTGAALCAADTDEAVSRLTAQRFSQVATNWVCDLMLPPKIGTNLSYRDFDPAVAAVLPDYRAMVRYAASNHYRILMPAITLGQPDPYRFKDEWDFAAAQGLLVVLPHNPSLSISRKPAARRLSPPRLSSAITVGQGVETNRMSFGPGLEFFDSPTVAASPNLGLTNQADAAGVVAGKLARILDANPGYNCWDARQHLRQSASHYAAGWVEDGGYGRPPALPATIATLDPAPPLDIRMETSGGGDSVTFEWRNFLQSSYAETVITRGNGAVIYHGNGTKFVWPSDVTGDETFHFFSRDKSGRLSRPESYTTLVATGLKRNAAPDRAPEP